MAANGVSGAVGGATGSSLLVLVRREAALTRAARARHSLAARLTLGTALTGVATGIATGLALKQINDLIGLTNLLGSRGSSALAGAGGGAAAGAIIGTPFGLAPVGAIAWGPLMALCWVGSSVAARSRRSPRSRSAT